MGKPTTETIERIQTAVKMRIDGASWKTIAKKFGYADESVVCTFFTVQNRETWRKYYEDSRENRLDEVEEIALRIALKLAENAKQEYVQERATNTILTHVSKMRGQRIELTGKDGSPLAIDSEEWKKERDLIIGELSLFPEARKALVKRLNGKLGASERFTQSS